jgi:hypothetical protein
MGRTAKVMLLLVVTLAMLRQNGAAQEKSKSDDAAPAEARPTEVTPLKVGVTIVEFQGDKKVASLPYTLVVLADAKIPKSVIKVGSRVPVYTGHAGSVQYLDVGNTIDCMAFHAQGGEFDVKLTLDQSWIEDHVQVPVDKDSSQSSSGQFPEPIVRQFRSDLSLMLRDGQSMESTFATDPLSGKVFKVEVSLTVLK